MKLKVYFRGSLLTSTTNSSVILMVYEQNKLHFVSIVKNLLFNCGWKGRIEKYKCLVTHSSGSNDSSVRKSS